MVASGDAYGSPIYDSHADISGDLSVSGDICADWGDDGLGAYNVPVGGQEVCLMAVFLYEVEKVEI